MILGFQGIDGAYSQAALFSHFGNGVQTKGFETFEDVVAAVKRKEISAGLLPIENSIVGSISENIDLLIREDLFIISEVYLRIRHHLLGIKGCQISGIKKALSHPAALSQCKDYLRMNNIQSVPSYDTAGAAKIISEQQDPTLSAIASKHCSELYNLDILAQDIQSFKNNFTRFFVVVSKEEAPKDLRREKTTFVFQTYHRPGALVEILHILSKHTINMTKLESRPIPENPWQYQFFVDIDGGLYDPAVLAAMAEIGSSTPWHKVLGSYPRGDQEGI